METVVHILETINSILNGIIAFLMIYQLILGFFGFRKKTKDYQDHDPKSRFLILVPAHNEEAVIPDMIDNLNRLDYPRELYDYYILADNCTDKTEEIARGLGANVLVTKRQSPDEPTGKPIVLQKALNMLEGYQDKYDLIMFFDADNLMDLNILREVNSQYLDNPGKADFIQCYLGCKNNDGIIALSDYMSYSITNRFYNYAKHRLHLNAGIGGTGFSVDAKYLYSRGGWTSMSLTEDFETQLEATCEGRRVLWNNSVHIYDEKPTTLKACFRQRTRWAQGRWFVTFKNTWPITKALFKGKISFWEYLSSMTMMYNMLPFIILVAEMIIGAAITIIRYSCGMQVVSTEKFGLVDMLVRNLPYVAIFLYSLIFLFYVGDRMDNNHTLPAKRIGQLLVAAVVNSYISGMSHLVGLFKWRQQSNWVKTEHKIKASSSMKNTK